MYYGLKLNSENTTGDFSSNEPVVHRSMNRQFDQRQQRVLVLKIISERDKNLI